MAEGPLFIVDNSEGGRNGLDYLREWSEVASSIDIATGYFEIGSLLDLDGHWQKFDKIRILMGDEVTHRTKKAMLLAVKQRAEAHLDDSIEDDSDSIDRVLEIFIRTNSGGTVLLKSDLLLPVATAQFTQLDARSAVHGLVDDLNSVGQGFAFTKDNVLKAGLMITDRQAIRFSVDAFTVENVAELEARWDEIENALRVAAQLLASFGFSERTLSAGSVLLPIADYIAQRGFGQDYVTSPVHRADREQVRRWVTRSLLKQGIWGSGLDTLLTRLRRAMRSSANSGFPVEALEREMAALGKSPALTSIEIEELVEVPIGNRRAFPLLAMLYPGVDVRNEFHVDHVFPRSLFASRKLSDAGIDGDLHDEYQDLRDRLPNLQLLEGPINVSKQATLPSVWVLGYQPDLQARMGWLAAHDLTTLPDDMTGFLAFYENRRTLMFERLCALLGSEDASPTSPQASLGPVPSSAQAPTAPSPASVPAQQSRPGGTTRRSFGRSLSELADGEVVYRIRGREHIAEVQNGRLVLADGEAFTSPSAAARALNGDVSVNGWKVWTRNGRSIGEIVDRDR